MTSSNQSLTRGDDQPPPIIVAPDHSLVHLRAALDELARKYEAQEIIVNDLVRHVASLKRSNRKTPLHKLPRKWVVSIACKTAYPLGVLRQYPPRKLKLPAPPPPAPQHSPGFCILTPSYSQGRFIERTLSSVLEQSYPKVRYGVQDGGSQDETLDILKRYASRLAYFDSAPDGGQANAINLGFERLQPQEGEIMAWLNSDDILLPGCLERVAAYFHNHPEVDAVYGHRVIIDEDDREVARWYLPQHDQKTLAWVDFIPQETLFWRASVWKKTGGLDPSFEFALDWDFLLKLEIAGCVLHRIPEFLGCFRVHDTQKTHLHINHTGLKEMNRLRDKQAVSPFEREQHIHNAIKTQCLRSGWICRLWSLGIKT